MVKVAVLVSAQSDCFAGMNLPRVCRLTDAYQYYLHATQTHIELIDKSGKKPFYIDYAQGQLGYRLQRVGKRDLIARAIGVKSDEKPSVLDLTAGLGRDAMVLAHVGCEVMMVERHPVIAILVQDALSRYLPLHPGLIISLQICDALSYLEKINSVEVIYIDPMFAPRQKIALVKKEMRILRDIVGEDDDATVLVMKALDKAKKRVVVKRGLHDPLLTKIEPNFQIKGKANRFDVYLCRALQK